MFPNYIINSITSINLSLACQASASTILSWTLGQIKIPCTSNRAKDIRNKNSILWIHKMLRRLAIKLTRKLLTKKKPRSRPELWNMEQILSKCGAAEKPVLHSQNFNFTILQTTNLDLVNSLHTAVFLHRQSMASFFLPATQTIFCF